MVKMSGDSRAGTDDFYTNMFRDAIDHLRSEGKSDEDILDLVWGAMESAIKRGDADFTKLVSGLIKYYYGELMEALRSPEESSDTSSEDKYIGKVIRIDQMMSGVGKEFRMFVVPQSRSMPREVICRFTIGDLKDLMYLDDDRTIRIDPAMISTDSGDTYNLWIARSTDRSEFGISALDDCGLPSFYGPLMIMGRDGYSPEPVSLSAEQVEVLESAIHITMQEDIIAETDLNGYVVTGLDQAYQKSEDAEEYEEESKKEDDNKSLKVTLPSGNTTQVDLINECLDRTDPIDNVEEMSFTILEALVITYRTKEGIEENLENFEPAIDLYHPDVVKAYRSAVHKVEILNAEQIDEIRRIVES